MTGAGITRDEIFQKVLGPSHVDISELAHCSRWLDSSLHEFVPGAPWLAQ